MEDWDRRYAARSERMRASEIRELLKLLDQPDIISFAGGIPDPALFPDAAFRAAYDEALRSNPGAALQYSTSEGHAPLREWLVGYMAGIGVPCTAENIAITAGSQQALDQLGKLFLSAGDTVLTTWPTYLGALQAFNAYEPRYDRLTPEQGNMTPQAYREAAAAAGGRVKLAYLTADFCNPTGETVSREGRLRVLELARELDIPVVEDAAYRALRYDGDAQPAILALDVAQTGDIERTRTIHCGSFSKTLAPGLRLGWICAASAVVRKVVLIKQAGDLHSPTINQMVMHQVAETVFAGQVEKVRTAYRARRDRMLAALARHMPPGVRWTRPEGGMFIWLTLPDTLDGARLLARSVESARVAFVPGGAFHPDGTGANTIRLSFSLAGDEAIDAGIARLAALIAEMAEGTARAA
ncbi:MAG: PLP-dependent aminotransferase family protein [Alphaproteobacteria bacterium]|nr:PLP-dependent aminotransferase family protein [Alphaproteobacteria bacterium]